MEAYMLPQCEARNILVTVSISTFWKNWILSLGRVFSAIWVVMALDRSPLGTQLGVEIQPLPVSSGLKTDSLNGVINIG